MGREGGERGPLFESREFKGRVPYKLFASSVFVGICLIWVFRATHVPDREGRWAWMGLFAADLCFGLYWIFTQSVRWNPIYRRTFRDNLSHKYGSEQLPGVDVFVCTADPTIEPPALVVSTVLSVMAYDYPPEKLAVYLSDDGGSDLTFYAMLLASRFAETWIPFCKKFQLEPRSPAAYFAGESRPPAGTGAVEWLLVQKLYQEMESKINTATKLGRIPEDVRKQHKGFSEWNSSTHPRDHQAIVQILIDRRSSNALDTEGNLLPTLVYMSREKTPHRHHNFKAGAMNALIRVSSEISNGAVILNVDCDMYSNNSKSVEDALCFFMDEARGHEIGYVQFPQMFNNITKNDIYGNSFKIIYGVDFHGLDDYGGPLYIGSGCFHRRWSLLGNKYSESCKEEWKRSGFRNAVESMSILEERAKGLATCTYEDNTQWGKEVGLKYGCPVEDVITGLSIQCRGWKGIYMNPEREAFLGVAPSTLVQTLVQQKRWSEGDFQIFVSKYCPFIYGHGRIKLGLQMGYCIYCLWAPNCLPTLYYAMIPSLYLLKGICLFPKVSSVWFIPYFYVTTATYTYSLLEGLWSGLTVKGWWNEQRIWLFKRTTSYLFAFIETILKLVGVNRSAFVITAKVADHDVARRYAEEVMDFGSDSPMFTILTTLALLNLFCFVGGVMRVAVVVVVDDLWTPVLDSLFLQFFTCGLLVAINMPLYRGLFFRKDNGRMPTSVTLTGLALVIGMLASLVPML